MANDFMRNVNKVSLDGEVVSFSDTTPIVEVKEKADVEPTVVEKPKKRSRKEEVVEETVVVEEKEEETIDMGNDDIFEDDKE